MAIQPSRATRLNPAAGALLASVLSASAAFAEQVTVETLDCDGDIGFSSFDDRRLHGIREGGCENPSDSSETLQQILLRSQTGESRYQVLWVTRAEARNVMEQIRANKGIRQQYLRQRNQVNVTVDPGQSSRGGRTTANPSPSGP